MINLSLLPFIIQPANGAVSSYVQLIFLNKGYSYGITGVILALGTMFQIVLPLFVATYADRHSLEKKTMWMAAFISVGLFVLVSVLSSSVLTVICYVLSQGVFWCLNPLQDSHITKCLGKNSAKYGVIRAIGTGSYVLFMSLFAIIGFPESTDNNQIILNICLLCAATGVVALFVKDYSKEGLEVQKKNEKEKFFEFSWFDSSFYTLILVVFISRITEGVVDRLLGSYIKDDLGLGNKFTLLVALGAFCEFFVLLICPKFVKSGKLTPVRAIIIANIGLFVRMVIASATSNVYIFAASQLLHGLGFGACHIGVTSYIARHVDKKHTTLAMTIYWSIAVNFAEMLGTLGGGFVIDLYGYRVLFALSSLFPLASVILCMAKRKVIGHLK